MPELVRVKVPGGHLIALPKGDGGKRPGVYVLFSADRESGVNLQSDPVACVEYDDGEIRTWAYEAADDEPIAVVRYNKGNDNQLTGGCNGCL